MRRGACQPTMSITVKEMERGRARGSLVGVEVEVAVVEEVPAPGVEEVEGGSSAGLIISGPLNARVAVRKGLITKNQRNFWGYQLGERDVWAV